MLLCSLMVLLLVNLGAAEDEIGNWSAWSSWSAKCSQTCGKGYLTRQRKCLHKDTCRVGDDKGAYDIKPCPLHPPCNEKPSFLKTPEPVSSVEEGETLQLWCEPEGWPRPTVRWLHQGKPLTGGGRWRFSHEEDEGAQLEVVDVIPADAGLYQCEASNNLSQASHNYTVMVTGPEKNQKENKYKEKKQAPYWISQKPVQKDIVSTVTFSQEISCKADGNPKPSITWYKDDQPFTRRANNATIE